VIALLLLLAAPAPSADWAAFAEARSGECVGPAGSLAAPIELTAGTRRYRLEGDRLIEVGNDADKTLSIGVISALKDSRDETLAQARALIARLGKIDVLIANGDLATNLFELQKVLPMLAETNALVVVITGNTESCGAFNQAAQEVFATHKNFINGNWVRRLELDDGTLITLPGYYDRRFTHTGGAAHYDEKDLEFTRDLTRDAPGPMVLVSHGPPKGETKVGIDVATDVGNVGDPAMTTLMTDAKMSFGIFGHILEAGGRATDPLGKTARAPGKWHPSLIVNAGTANPDPWSMLGGGTAYGMALKFELEPKRAKYSVERAAKPKD